MNLKSKLKEQYGNKVGDYERWKILYIFLNPVSAILLLASATFSAKFYQTHFFSSVDSEYSFVLAFILSLLVSAVIGTIAPRLIHQYKQEDTINYTTGAILFAALLLNYFGDFKGAPKYSEMLLKSPTDIRSNDFALKMDSLKRDINTIYASYQWKTYTPSTPAELMRLNNKYGNGDKPRQHVEQIKKLEAERESYKKAFDQAQKEHSINYNEYLAKKEEQQSTFRYGTIFINSIYLFIAWWRVTWAISIAESDDHWPVVKHIPAEGGHWPSGQTPIPNYDPKEAEYYWAMLMKEQPEIAEELMASREHENAKKKA